MLRLCRKEVTGLSVHPTGLLALSTSRDDMLRMWNMAKGRSQYKTKIPPSTEAVSFSPDGSMYALLSGTQVRWQPSVAWDASSMLLHEARVVALYATCPPLYNDK